MRNFPLNLIERLLDFLAMGTKVIAQVMVAVMVLIMVISVTARYVFNHPLNFADEYVMYLMVGLSVLAANWVLKEKGHIKVDVVILMLSPRVRAWVLVFTEITTIFAVTIIMLQVIKLTRLSFEVGTLSETVLRTPIGPIQSILPIAFGLLLLELLRTTVISIKTAALSTEP